VEHYVLANPGKAPGPDHLTVRLLEAAWPWISDWVLELYRRSLKLRHFPAPFKLARMVFLGKPGKKDYTKVNTSRPISLLSNLGKGLERIIARTLAYRAIASNLVATQQAGAVPGRSATDLIAALIHDCEAARDKKRHRALMLMDIRGGFNAVQHQRLVNRLNQQGWGQEITQ